MWQRLNHAAATAVATAIFYGLALSVLLVRLHGDVSLFVVAGGPLVDPARVPPGLTVIPNIGGYDGLAFYRLALDPFTRQQTAHGIALDNPPYRHQRIGYPFVVWCLSAGNAAYVPLLLLAVNVASVIVLGFVGGALARDSGSHALAGLLVSLYPGFVIVLTRDTSELLAAALMTLGIWTLRDRPVLATLLFCCAVLTRETTLIVPCAYWLMEGIAALRTRSLRPRTFLFGLPLVTYATMQMIMGQWWGAVPVSGGSSLWTVPFREFFRLFASVTPPEFHLERVYFYECLYLIIIIIATAAASLFARRIDPSLRVAWLLYLALTFSLSAAVWSSDIAFLRAATEIHVVSAVLLLQASARAPRLVCLAATLAMWVVVAKHVYDYF